VFAPHLICSFYPPTTPCFLLHLIFPQV
jgi:hypothetical protein